ncbi:bifunctional DedA family/phosphatase PAP2 family protein [Bosea sp. (in: a-proteobacteria)]|uniref:bifunctional DedA family/phosphatase PAP2 family protein n=1 Tax=Bosea sp. (in: a-proteobacteria) TaxID=1871050 RepID=UPI00122A3859|nr:bifunctional DedA family/phosphatase PAP2 family protein [Bosea sp. (in: a-proteobacteria)]TAJ29333.1 MAG: phosphatase PAP2 family protein [Bosea sp. (in: a-proteobacteria)]
MMTFFDSYIQSLLAFAGQNIGLVALIVFLAALSEAIVLIGAVIPGTAIILAAAAIVGASRSPIWPILLAATLGAIAGDGISYWMGHRYKHRIPQIWPFRRYPRLLDQGDAYFASHGGKSVFIARFLPGVRAVVPISAGVSGMSVPRFYAANILSALIWAPAHVLPATALGASAAVLGQASGRLLVMLAIAGLAIAGVILLGWFCWSKMLPWISARQEHILEWARTHDNSVSRLVLRVLDPARPDDRAVGLLVGAFAFAFLGFINLLEEVAARGELARADLAMSNFVQSLRTDVGDRIMIVITGFGDGIVIGALTIVALAWLAWRRSWRLAGGLAILLVATAAFVPALKSTIQIARPLAMYSGAEAYSFPSGHATFAATFFGFAGWLTLRGLPLRWRWLPLAVSAIIIGLIVSSRVYLAAHWPSDVAAGTIFGIGTTLIVALIFRKDDLAQARPAWVGLTLCAALLMIGSIHVYRTYPAAEVRYVRHEPSVAATKAEWADARWATLPRHRIDLEGDFKEPIVLQWAGPPPELEAALAKLGWTSPRPWSAATLASMFSSNPSFAELPVLPRLNNGQAAVVTMMKVSTDGATRQILRAWAAPLSITDLNSAPVLIISVVRESIWKPLDLVALPRPEAASSGAAELFDHMSGLIGVRPSGKGLLALAGGK